MMRRFRAILWFLLVVVTAASMLLASTPLVVCACVTSRTEPIEETPVCCCGGSCCAMNGEQGSCCTRAQTARSADEEQDAGPMLKAPDCRQIVLQSDALSIEQREIQVKTVWLACVQACEADSILLPAKPLCADWPWEPYRLPPPTNLVITLQHFLN